MNLRRKDRILLPTEISEAETFWIKQAQAQAQPFPGGENEGSLTQLNPKSDGDGLLRMDGRLRFADELLYDTRHPILLPKDHPVLSFKTRYSACNNNYIYFYSYLFRLEIAVF